MFKRLTTSLSRPPQTVFFMKDSWKRIVLYILLVPLVLIIPALLTVFADPSMNIRRYDLLTETVKDNFRLENAQIIDGSLTYETSTSANFDAIFFIYLGQQSLNRNSFNFVFEENDLVLYLATQEVDRESYANLSLLNHDFSSTDPNQLREINLALKSLIERQPTIIAVDMLANYTFSLMDYLFVVFVMSIMMFVFVTKIPIPYVMRFKLSVYLSTVWAASQLILSLFHAESFEFISLALVYLYHIVAYRSIRVINKGVI